MSDNPYPSTLATYADNAGAEADYNALLELHSAKLVGTYDIASVTKDARARSTTKSMRSRPSTAPGEESPSESAVE